MEVVGLEIEQGQFRVGDLDTGRVLASIKFGSNLQARLCRCVGDQIDDDFVTHQRPTSPVLGDVREHAVLDLVPFAGARREVAHMDGQPQVATKLCNATFHKRHRLPLLPPPSAVINNALACG